jgi:hypothetical protein
MYKQEQCISNLEQQIGWIEDIKAHQFPGWGHTVNAMRQAIALLKAQEPVKPVPGLWKPVPGLWDRDIPSFNCGACGKGIGAEGRSKYCFHCGQAVKWG